MKRRALLQGLGLSPLALVPGEAVGATGLPNVTVESLEVFRVHVNHRGDWTIPRLKTNSGVTGIGDASQSGHDEETPRYLKQFSELLRGRSVFDIEWYRETTDAIINQLSGNTRRRAGVAASALEHCLWDIQGQILSVPTYNLFGGRIQPRIRVYANINRSTDDRTPEGFARTAQRAVAAGYDAFKLAPFDGMPRKLPAGAKRDEMTAMGIACAQAVRDTIGPDRALLVDAHSHFNLEQGLDLARRFEPLNLYWLEEVTPRDTPENVAALAAINKAAKMNTAGGESIHGVDGFYPYIKAEAVDIVMPDVKVCGGMLELKKISAMAEGAGLPVAPHGPTSPIGNVAAGQVMATTPNFNILELAYGEVPWRAELIDPPEQVENSTLALSTRPGFGIKLNEKTVAKYGAAI